MKAYLKLPVLFVLGILLFTSCSSSRTTISASWSNPESGPKQFNNIMVLALAENVSSRGTAEQAVVDELTKNGFNAVQGLSIISPDQMRQLDDRQEEARELLADAGIDGAIVIRVLDVKEDERWVPGHTTTYPSFGYPYYGGFYGYWGHSYNVVSTPGYYASTTSVFLESNLYDIKTDELLWSAQSVSEDPESVKNLSRQFSQVIVKDLQDKNIITK